MPSDPPSPGFQRSAMPELAQSQRTVTGAEVDAVAVAMLAGSGDSGPAVAAPAGLPGKAVTALETAARQVRFGAGAGETVRIPAVPGLSADFALLVGLGKDPVSPATVRKAAGAAARALSGVEGVTRVALVLPASDVEQVRAAAEGALLGSYTFTRYKREPKPGLSAVVLDTTAARGSGITRKALDEVVRRAVETAAAVALTRDLVNLSPSQLYPESFAQIAVDVGAEAGFEVTVLDEADLAEGGYGGLLAVGQGSARGPRLVMCQYRPKRAKRHVALVGKGITFDSGGLSLKPPNSMVTMKCDMAGAAAVLATMAAAARTGLQVHVTGYLAMAENMPSGTAQRPSDVITVHGGTTVEVLNTDAEGRLVLADALAAASKTGPDAIVDIATLTGAATVALGSRTSALVGNDDDLVASVTEAARLGGEPTWHLPLIQELRSGLDSPIADIANVTSKRDGGTIVGGLFLREFVGTKAGKPIPWVHLDVAGPAFNDGGAEDVTPKGGTGVPVRTLIRLLEATGEAS